MEERVLSDINMDRQMLEDGVQHLKDWINKQPHLPHITDENLLKSFIIGSKSVENAKARMEKYLCDRNKYPCFYSNRDPTQIDWSRIEVTSFLPGLTDENYKVLVIRVPTKKDHVSSFDLEMALKAKFLMLDRLIRHEPFISGFVILTDYKDTSLKIIYKYTSMLIASAIDCFQKGYPLRLKKLVLFNAPWFATAFFNNFVKYLFSEKLRKRLFVYAGDHSVLTFVPSTMLPKEYGGDNPSLDHLFEETQKELVEEREWFMTDGSIGADESKRVKHTKEEEAVPPQ